MNKKDMTWLRRPEESAVAYAAFREYYQLSGHVRSCDKVAKKLGKSNTIIERWCARHQWVERAADYDNSLAEEAYKTTLEEIKKMEKEHAAIGVSLRNKGVKAMLLIKVEDMNERNAIEYILRGAEMERRARYSDAETQRRKADKLKEIDGVQIIDDTD